MTEIENKENIRDHLANERTLLAWIRTSIGIMALGFVVVKFSLFVKQIGLVLGKQTVIQQKGYSAILGIVLVAVGVITSLLAYLRYKKTQKQINENNYQSSSLIINLLIVFIFLMSVLLIAYLIQSA